MSRRAPSRTFISTQAQPGFSLSRYAVFFLTALAFFLVIWGQIAPASQARARAALMTLAAPVVDLFSRPLEAIRETSEGVKSYADLQTEVAELKRQNTELLQWEAQYRKAAAENQRLREITEFMEPFRLAYKTTRIVSDPGSAYARSLLIEGGTGEGFQPGFAVVGQRGLVGRIVEVGPSYSRVMLVTDLSARIPVFIEQVQRTALVSGRNTPFLEMRFLNQTVQRSLKLGDRVVTSGQAGLLPPNIPVGVVASVNATGVQVLPYLEIDTLMEVQVITSTRPKPQAEEL